MGSQIPAVARRRHPSEEWSVLGRCGDLTTVTLMLKWMLLLEGESPLAPRQDAAAAAAVGEIRAPQNNDALERATRRTTQSRVRRS